jgi:hypothetical protein
MVYRNAAVFKFDDDNAKALKPLAQTQPRFEDLPADIQHRIGFDIAQGNDRDGVVRRVSDFRICVEELDFGNRIGVAWEHDDAR